MSTEVAEVLRVIGRLFLGGLFVAGGIRHFFILPVLTQVMSARGVPSPRLVLVIGSVFQLVAGLLLIFGIWPGAAAFGLVLFTITASVMLLNFWDMEGPARETAMNGFLSNVAIIGGLLLAAAGTMQ
jgi:putative oxidoreductase